MKDVILLNLFISSFMFGVIIVTQIVNYPLLLDFFKSDLKILHKSYVNKISIIVIPFMLLELFVALYLVYNEIYLSYTNLGLLIIIYLSTFFIQVPIHDKIKYNANKILLKKLILSNWIRTFSWLLKSIISVIIILKEVL
tara:strand:+ start:1167 stop:1586 length:420 start_codon:yes stop_codon:yes gene_type:complete